MKLLQLKAKDFRSLKDLEINFPDEQVIAIIGNNGSGKTAVLDAIEICFNKVIHHLLRLKNFDFPANDRASEFAIINLKYNVGENEYDAIVSVQNSSVNCPISDIEIRPRFMYYASPRNYDDNTDKNETYHKMRKLVDSLGVEMGGRISKQVGEDFKDWFVAQTRREDEEIKNYNLFNIKSAINTFFSHLEDERFGSMLVKNIGPPDVYIEKGSFSLKLSQLSAGEKMLIYIVADIAKRLTIFSDEPDTLKREYLVLIDEIDLHLHPSWQKSVVKALSATFPNVQFVITTHSPLILNQLKTASILVLEDGKCTPLSEKYQSFNSYGADLEDILKIVQGTENLLPKDIQQKLDEINAKLNEGAIEDAKDLIEKLKTLTDPNQPELKKAETQIQYKELLKK